MRYLKLYGYFLQFSFSKAMVFRFDFLLHILMDIAWYVTQIIFFTVIFNYTKILGGWNYDQILIFMGSIFVVDAIQMTFFYNNIWWLPVFINKGELDYYLIRPVSSLFFLTLRDFASNSLMNLILSIAFLAWTILRYPSEILSLNLLSYIILLLCGALLFSIMNILFVIPVFWMHTDKGLKEIFSSLQRFGNQPHRIYKGWIKYILTSILPFAFIASYPASVLFEGPTWQIMLYSFLILSCAVLFLVWFWKQGLKAYSSASS